MQMLTDGVTVIDQIIVAIKRFPIINEIVLGISEGNANASFLDVAQKHGIGYIYGDPEDVLMRLVQCGKIGRATDVFRVTTECPWFDYDMLEPLWKRHVEHGNDITATDRLPEGLNFEIYTQESLERSHKRGSSVDRSEFCSNYPRKHPHEFKIEVVLPPQERQRMDLRVAVDCPEDLIVCREITKANHASMTLISSKQIVEFLDARPDLRNLVAPFVVPEALWDIF